VLFLIIRVLRNQAKFVEVEEKGMLTIEFAFSNQVESCWKLQHHLVKRAVFVKPFSLPFVNFLFLRKW
jgi:hypothetical protein